MSLRARLAAFLALLALAAAPLRARADDKADPQIDEARKHAAAAKVHYDLGEYEQAAQEYIAVYRIKALPQLLFNIAQAYRQGALYDKAKQFYKAYLRESPDAKNRAIIEQNIREIDDLLAREKHTREASPKGVTAEPVVVPPALPALPEKKAEAPAPAPEKVPEKVAEKKPAPGSAAPAAPAAAEKKAPPAAEKVPEKAAEKAPEKAAEKAPEKKLAAASPNAAPAPSPGWSGTQHPAAQPVKAPTQAVSSPAPQAASHGGMRTAAWITGGTAVALLGGGGLFVMKASKTDSDLQSGLHTRAEADSLISQSKSSHSVGAGLLAVGAAAAVTSGVLFLLSSGD